jgi:catechol 2,3-dioxygenase-like lactoylglutathione lyase family enzyme
LTTLGLGRPFDQVCVVVPDLESAIESYSDTLGISSWVGWRYDGDYLAYRTYRGQPADWSMRVAVTTSLHPQFEIVEPERGPSILGEHLEQHGAGLQHVAYFVPAFESVQAHLERQGGHLVQAGGGHGLDGDGGFGYFELPRLGIVLEVIEPPARRADPHFVWP